MATRTTKEILIAARGYAAHREASRALPIDERERMFWERGRNS